MTTHDFTAAYDRILAVTGTRTQVELAAVLSIRQSGISDAKRRNSVPADWLLTLLKLHSINPAWILTGEGPQYLAGSDGMPVSPPAPLMAAGFGDIVCTTLDRAAIEIMLAANRLLTPEAHP